MAGLNRKRAHSFACCQAASKHLEREGWVLDQNTHGTLQNYKLMRWGSCTGVRKFQVAFVLTALIVIPSSHSKNALLESLHYVCASEWTWSAHFEDASTSTRSNNGLGQEVFCAGTLLLTKFVHLPRLHNPSIQPRARFGISMSDPCAQFRRVSP